MRTHLSTSRSRKRGLSGAVTALILVIASVIIALVVVGFAFGLIGGIGGSGSTVQVGTGFIDGNGDLIVTLHNEGSSTVQVISVSLAGQAPQSITPIPISAGQVSQISLASVLAGATRSLSPGTTYTITLGLSNGQSVTVSAVYQ